MTAKLEDLGKDTITGRRVGQVTSDKLMLAILNTEIRELGLVLRKGRGLQIVTCLERHKGSLNESINKFSMLYCGPYEYAHFYWRAWNRFVKLNKEMSRLYVGLPGIGRDISELISPSGQIRVDFYYALVMLLYYPLVIFGQTSKEYIESSSYQTSIPQTGIESLFRDILLLERLVIWIANFGAASGLGSGRDFLDELRRYPSLVKRVGLLSLPLYTTFVKTGRK